MNKNSFESASGIRPASAFLMIAIVLVVASANAVRISMKEVEGPRTARVVRAFEPDFDIVDRNGTPLAFSVRRLDLVLSPRSMWRAHTPDYMAECIAETIGGEVDEEQLLKSFLPDAEGAGVHVISAEDLPLSRLQAERVTALFEQGLFVEEDETRPMRGMFCLPTSDPDVFQLAWEPWYVLSKECRDHQADRSIAPIAWTNRLLFRLGDALRGKKVDSKSEQEAIEVALQEADLLWDLLMPTGHVVALEDLPLENAYGLFSKLEEEGVKSHQMELCPRVARTWPQREVAEAAGRETSLEILGRWGYVSKERATALAEEHVGYPRPEVDPGVLAQRPDLRERVAEFDASYRANLAMVHPTSGLERSIDRLLRRPEWSFLERTRAEYRFEEHYCARPRGARRYYVEASESSDPPRVTTTLDLDLQRFVRQTLEEVRTEHDPAAAMCIVVDVQSGDVLAVDGVSAYGVRAFLPTWHLFTPGSTFKVPVMAIALDQGVTTPDTPYNAHLGEWRVPESRRTIHEAEGERKEWVTATEGVAYSLNVVLAQIGMSIDDDHLHRKLTELGYLDAPGQRLGTERAGRIPELPWKRAWEHASVSFGHEVLTSLWQHATALSTILRGGVPQPLRLLASVEQAGEIHEIREPEGERVFERETCIQVREMMYMGAREGTGRDLFDERVWMGTKTGTAEKVPGEMCLHVELQHNRDLQDPEGPDGELHRCDKKCRRKLAARPKPHKHCYTSSICAFGRLPGTERELMVLMVVDEPRGKEKYGSRVAGPAGKRVLFEALGLTQDGRELDQPFETAVEYTEDSLNHEDHPWAEDVR